MKTRQIAAVLTITILFPLAALGQNPVVKDAVNWETFMARHDLVWEALPQGWNQGAFVGNGLLGAMIYADKECPLRWDIGRSDVVDHRNGGNAVFDKPRLPIGHFVLRPVGKVKSGDIRLGLWNAEAAGTLRTERGKIQWRSFVHAQDLVIVVELAADEGEKDFQWTWVAEVSESTRTRGRPSGYKPNPPSKLEKDGQANVCVQPLLAGGQYATAWREVKTGPLRRVVYISVGDSHPGDEAHKQALSAVESAAGKGIESLTASHRKWWHEFYPQSFVSVPDQRIETFYWIQMYKLGSATRDDRPCIDLMGPWFRATGWPAIWWNLNIQLTYYPVYTSNRLELGESLCRMLDHNVQNLIKNVKPEYQSDSAAVGRVTSYDCLGSVGKEVGDLTWTLHNYWRQCRYAADDQRLRENLFPLLRRSVNYYLHLLEKGKDGKLHLPSMTSPEYGDAPDTSYDLSLLRWGCLTLLQTAERFKINDPLIPRWKEVLANLTPYATGPNGLMIGRGVPLAHSHRHYSHMLMIYPLHIMTWDEKENRDLITKSLNHWIGFKGALQGYSYTGASSICSTIGRRDDAVKYLNGFLDGYVQPNTMYLEGSPVIETPLSAAESLHDILLQSWGSSTGSGQGTIRVFPGVPDSWKDAAFHNLRAEGAFLVSAVRKNGKTRFVRVQSMAGEPCRIQIDGGPVKELKLAKGQEVILGEGDTTIEPVPADPDRCNYYGVKKDQAAKRKKK